MLHLLFLAFNPLLALFYNNNCQLIVILFYAYGLLPLYSNCIQTLNHHGGEGEKRARKSFNEIASAPLCNPLPTLLNQLSPKMNKNLTGWQNPHMYKERPPAWICSDFYLYLSIELAPRLGAAGAIPRCCCCSSLSLSLTFSLSLSLPLNPAEH